MRRNGAKFLLLAAAPLRVASPFSRRMWTYPEMLLTSGGRLGPYEIVAPLGVGGMAEVYEARDTRLKRKVAIKVLPPQKQFDESAKRRFLKEARAASTLNHPNIAAIYDICSEQNVDFIVMEYVNGAPLGSRNGRKIGLEQAIAQAIQVADALGAAHAAGIVHRDLKPANILVTEQGAVKVLDFGVAKLEPTFRQNAAVLDGLSPSHIDEPTISIETTPGTLIGTAPYMSPEQARGEKVDRRSDIFSFGIVVYELLTGRRAFAADTMAGIIAAILVTDPKPIRDLRPDVPLALQKIVERCLRKDPALRYQCIDDARLDLMDVNAETEQKRATASVTRRMLPNKRRYVAAATLLAALGLAIAAWFFFRPEPPGAGLTAVPFTSYPGNERFATFSPDGSQVAFSWDGDKQDNFDIYVKLIGTGAPLRLTSNPAPDFYPAWSPDGRWIAFVRLLGNNAADVMIIPALGGPERILTRIVVPPQVAYIQGVNPPRVAWSPDNQYLVIVDRSAPGEPFSLFSLTVETGEKRRLTAPPKPGLMDSGPAVSPGGEAVVFTRSSSNLGSGDLYLLPLSTGIKPAGAPKRLTFDNRQNGHAAWTADARNIIFSSPRSGGTFALWKVGAHGGAPERLPSVGEDAIYPAISRQGKRLIYTKYSLDSNIWRVGASGAASDRPDAAGIPVVTSTRQDVMPQYSPDGKKVVFSSDRSGYFQIWVSDADGSNAIQLTSFDGVRNFHPSWSPDAQLIAFQSNAEGADNIYLINAGGGKPKRLTIAATGGEWPSFSRDGKWVISAH